MATLLTGWKKKKKSLKTVKKVSKCLFVCFSFIYVFFLLNFYFTVKEIYKN